MSDLLRHLASLVLLPGVVTAAVPLWIARRYGIELLPPEDVTEMLAVAAGLAVLALGITLFVASLLPFFTRGRGTLAPWDPPRRLVISGPYRYVRNPMIAGVLFVLFGGALVLRSMPHFIWALACLALNTLYIPLAEEPGLERRFGADYVRYRANVRRFLPRSGPWDLTRPRPDSPPLRRPAGPPPD